MVEINIWSIQTNKYNLVTDYTYILSNEEKKTLSGLINIEDKNIYCLSHIYLRLYLSKYFPKISPENWEFVKNKYGKPEISPKHKISFFFNLSHSKTHIAIIFSKYFMCGIDIEENVRDINTHNLIDFVCTENEKIVYNNTINKEEYFYILWTRKEAYLKALGTGLYKSLKSIEFVHIFIEEVNDLKNQFLYGSKKIKKNVYLSYVLLSPTEDISIVFNLH